MNDALCYRTLPCIGHGRARNLRRRARILADGGYAARVPLIVHMNASNRPEENSGKSGSALLKDADI